MTFPNGGHVAEVEIGRETGQVTLARYTAVDDYGVPVNPMIAMGQAHGVIAQGVGQPLLEHATYDRSSGQLLAGSLMDYALPRADDLSPYDLGFMARVAPPTRSASGAAERRVRSARSPPSPMRYSTHWRRSGSPLSPGRRFPSASGGRSNVKPPAYLLAPLYGENDGVGAIDRLLAVNWKPSRRRPRMRVCNVFLLRTSRMRRRAFAALPDFR